MNRWIAVASGPGLLADTEFLLIDQGAQPPIVRGTLRGRRMAYAVRDALNATESNA